MTQPTFDPRLSVFLDLEEASYQRMLSPRGADLSQRDIIIAEDEVVEAPLKRMGVSLSEKELDDIQQRLAQPDYFPIHFLGRMNQFAQSVGRIRVVPANPQKEVYHGTGFLVAPGLILTNAHILANKDIAKRATIEFEFEKNLKGEDKEPVSFALQPDTCWIWDDPYKLDYVLVAVAPLDLSGEVEIGKYGFIPLPTGPIILQKSEFLTIIQHPNGGRKMIALRGNRFLDMDGPYVRYTTDTAKGSSGSAVFNDRFEVVALHHSGVVRRNEDDELLMKNGDVFDNDPAKKDELDWIANEGVLISDILTDIREKAQELAPDAIVSSFLAQLGPDPTV